MSKFKIIIFILLIMVIGKLAPAYFIHSKFANSTAANYAILEARHLFSNPFEKLIVTGYQVAELNNIDWVSEDYGNVPKTFKAQVRVFTLFGIKYADVRVEASGTYRTN